MIKKQKMKIYLKDDSTKKFKKLNKSNMIIVKNILMSHFDITTTFALQCIKLLIIDP